MTSNPSEPQERWEIRRVAALSGGWELYRGAHAYAVFWWRNDALDIRDRLNNAALARPEPAEPQERWARRDSYPTKAPERWAYIESESGEILVERVEWNLAGQIVADHNAALARPEPAAGEPDRIIENLAELAKRAGPYIRAKSEGRDVAAEKEGCRLWVRDYDEVMLAVPEDQPHFASPTPAQSGETGLLEEAVKKFLQVMGRDAAGNWFIHREDDIFRECVQAMSDALDAAQEESKSE